jgi:glycosyltransferase involved in cell wall biosynthesis
MDSASPGLESADERQGPRPLLSIVTATYNAAGFIERLYQSLCAQESHDFEWIVVDDRSTDDTFAVVKSFMSRAPFPMRAYRLPQNSGGALALAYGFQAAEGELLCHIDHDDALVPGAILRLEKDWPAVVAAGTYSGLFYRSIDGASHKLNGRPMRFGRPTTTSKINNLYRNPCDGVYMILRDLMQSTFTYEYVAECCLNGIVWQKITKHRPVYCGGDQVFYIYNRDNAQSQTNAPKVGSYTVYSYAEIFNNGDAFYLLRPILQTRTLLNLMRYSKAVYNSCMTGVRRLNSPLLRAYCVLLLPLHAALWNTVWKPVILAPRKPYPIDRLDQTERARPG